MSTQAVNACIFFLIYKKRFTIQAVRATVQNEWNVVAIKAHIYIRVYHMHAFEIALCATSEPCIEESDTTFCNIGAQPEHYLMNREKKNNASHTQLQV